MTQPSWNPSFKVHHTSWRAHIDFLGYACKGGHTVVLNCFITLIQLVKSATITGKSGEGDLNRTQQMIPCWAVSPASHSYVPTSFDLTSVQNCVDWCNVRWSESNFTQLIILVISERTPLFKLKSPLPLFSSESISFHFMLLNTAATHRAFPAEYRVHLWHSH